MSTISLGTAEAKASGTAKKQSKVSTVAVVKTAATGQKT